MPTTVAQKGLHVFVIGQDGAIEPKLHAEDRLGAVDVLSVVLLAVPLWRAREGERKRERKRR